MHFVIVWSYNQLLAYRDLCDIMHVLNGQDKLVSHNEYNDGDKLYSYCFRSINETIKFVLHLIIDRYFNTNSWLYSIQ